MTFVQLIQGGALFAMRRCRINLYPVGIEARTKVPCMGHPLGHPLSRGDFHSFPLFLFLQFFCSAPAEPILPPRPLVPSAGARSGGQGWPAFGPPRQRRAASLTAASTTAGCVDSGATHF